MSDDVDAKCILCSELLNDDRPQRTLEHAAISKCISASLRRKDDVHTTLAERTSVIVHEVCAKNYTAEEKIKRYLQQKSNQASTNRLSRSSIDSDFDFKNLCFVCSEDASDEYIKKQAKKPTSSRRIVRYVTKSETGKSIFEKLINRSDPLAVHVSFRINSVPNLVDVNARYHHDCIPRLLKEKLDHIDLEGSITSKAARFIVEYIIKNEDETCQFSMLEILSKFNIDSDSMPHLKYIIKHLKDSFGDDLMIHRSADGPIITFANVGKKILTEKWYKNKCSDATEERKRLVKTTSKIILQDIKNTPYDTKHYPAPNCFFKKAKEDIPSTLLELLSEIITQDKSKPENYEPIIIAIAHAIIAATRPRSFVSSVQVGLAAMLNKQYGSKELIEILHSLGFCASYKEVQLLEASVLNHEEVITFQDSYAQQVSDNADHNMKTIDGFNTFHAMGSILVITPSESVETSHVIERVNKSPNAEIIGKFGKVHVKSFRKPPHSGLQNICVKDLNDISPILSNIEIDKTDFLWHYCKYRNSNFEGWNGTMEMITSGMSYNTSRIIFLPFINAQPSKLDVIYTTLLQADQKRKALKQKHIFVTFDQPLYYKAREILECCKEELSGVKCRLGGFHSLMSFMGSIGNVMEGSGIDKLFSTIYAENSVDKILSGHAYSRAIRGHILVHLALGHCILESLELTEEEKRSLDKFIDSEQLCESLLTSEFKDLFSKFLSHKKQLEQNGPTSKLWLQYFDMVSIMKQFIMADRSGNYEMHLSALRRMLPYFHSSGHYLYAKSVHLYLQDMYELESSMDIIEFHKYVKEGFFTVRRTDKFWSGISTDMAIEQVLMRSMKTRGGLTRGRGITDAVLAKWILTMPILTEISDCMQSFCNVNIVTSEQHVDSRGSRIDRDTADLRKLMAFFNKFNPFLCSDKVVCITSGVQGNSNVNCHNALEIGVQLMQDNVGKKYSELKFSRKNKVVNLRSMNSIKMKNEDIVINPVLIFQRIAIAMESKTDLKNYFAYELAPYPLSIFDSNIMRKTQKSKLFDCFKPIDNVLHISECRYVVDGGFLLHKVIWPQGETFETLLNCYVDFVKRHYSANSIIVFDGYPENLSTSTKHAERKRRQAKQQCGEIIFNLCMTANVNQEKFLSNDRNKNLFIQSLRQKLHEAGFQTVQAVEDADFLLVETAVKIATSDKPVIVVSQDIDVLVILIQCLQKSNKNVYFMKPSKGNVAEKIYGSDSFLYPTIKHLIAFIHAFSGCDCTSAFFNKGKIKIVKMLLNNPALSVHAATFYTSNISGKAIEEAGNKLIVSLYGGKKCLNVNINTLRYILFKGESRKKNFNLASLPPTASAANFHCRRVYYQVQQWLGNEIDPREWGWKVINNALEPIQTDDALVPESLLVDISCKCAVKCGKTCSCVKHGLKCSEYCSHCNGQNCNNANTINYNEIDFELEDTTDSITDELEDYFEPQLSPVYDENSADESDCEIETPSKKRRLSNA